MYNNNGLGFKTKMWFSMNAILSTAALASFSKEACYEMTKR